MLRVVFPILLSVSMWIDPPHIPIDIPDIPIDIPFQPQIEDMCMAITSYWVWDDNGDIFDGWMGQCNEDCSKTGAGYDLPARAEDYTENYAACIFDWTSLKGYPTTLVDVPGYGEYKCVDNFGDQDYWVPFYHDYYEQWVIPIDLLNPYAHNLVCNWTTGWWTSD